LASTAFSKTCLKACRKSLSQKTDSSGRGTSYRLACAKRQRCAWFGDGISCAQRELSALVGRLHLACAKGRHFTVTTKTSPPPSLHQGAPIRLTTRLPPREQAQLLLHVIPSPLAQLSIPVPDLPPHSLVPHVKRDENQENYCAVASKVLLPSFPSPFRTCCLTVLFLARLTPCLSSTPPNAPQPTSLRRVKPYALLPGSNLYWPCTGGAALSPYNFVT